MKRSISGLAIAFTALPLAAAAMVNVNTAQQSELQRTKGLDRQKAKAIIDYRYQNGFYDSLDDLEKVPGITRETLTRLEDQITFTGDPYVPGSKSKDKEKAADKGARTKR